MSKIRILAFVGVLSAVLVVGALPVGAHDTCSANKDQRATHGADFACVENFHSNLKACDEESDGHGVRAHWRPLSGDINVGSWDTNGADPGCANDYLPGHAIQYRICENDVGCSDWKDK